MLAVTTRNRLHSARLCLPMIGLDLPPRALVITLWRDRPAARARALDLLDRELGAAWTMRWQPADYEIGHWDGLRLRQAARLGARRR